MFPYRPAPLNNRRRILIAAFLAAVFHAGLMHLEFPVKPFTVPVISLPRSVNVFLDQRHEVEAPAAEEGMDLEPEISPIIPEPQIEAVQKNPAGKIKPADSIPPPVIRGETVKIPAETATETNEALVEDIIPAVQESRDTAADLLPEENAGAKMQQQTPDPTPRARDNNREQKSSGIIQTAYPRYRLNKPPVYPGLARKRGQEGTVVLQVLVDREGRVDDLAIETSSGFGLLDRAAVSAVRNWRFEPGRKDRKKTTMWVRIPVTFELKE